jgi:acyl carrier protein
LKSAGTIEIGCGVGLLVQHLAPSCSAYMGTDLSGPAVNSLARWSQAQPNLKHVELLHREATDFSGLEPGRFDTVILNSVVQYFPDIDYLTDVIEGAAKLVGPGGRVFVGDVRNLAQLQTFHAAVQVSRAGFEAGIRQVRGRISRAIVEDKELLIDPDFFQALRQRLPQIGAVDICLKQGQAANELMRHRYDVVLHIGEPVRPSGEWRMWDVRAEGMEGLESMLRNERPPRVGLQNLPNRRLAADVAARDLVESLDAHMLIDDLRSSLRGVVLDGYDPDAFHALGKACGYEVRVRPLGSAEDGRFDVVMFDPAALDDVRAPNFEVRPPDRSLGDYVNDPLAWQLKSQLNVKLRNHLNSFLPEYMIPSSILVLDAMPLTQNGKLDRAGLPEPESRPDLAQEFVPPSSEIEIALADIWIEALEIDRVGVLDNFFELGGHSLLATRVIAQIREKMGIEVPLRVMFENPTISGLATHIEMVKLLLPVVEKDQSDQRVLDYESGVL